MSSINDVVFTIDLEGKKQLTNLFSRETFNITGKMERDIVIVKSDDWVDVPISNIGIIQRIIVEAQADEDISFRLSIDDGVQLPYYIELPMNKIFIYNVAAIFAPYITALGAKTDSNLSVTVKFRVYS